MFPFDIDWVDNQYDWIIYSCNPNSDWSWCEQHLTRLETDPQFDEIMQHIELFRLMSKNNVDSGKELMHIVLRKVQWNKKGDIDIISRTEAL
jgi:hypothetical protein